VLEFDYALENEKPIHPAVGDANFNELNDTYKKNTAI
jgi:hypothetical protein